MSGNQLSFLGNSSTDPDGFLYCEGLVAPDEERGLAERLSALAFAPFEFHGFIGKRRVISFGWRYVFDGSGLTRGDPIPEFLLPVRTVAAGFAGLAPEALEHVLVTEYAPGAGIGWHKDRSVFGDTIGISLLAPCRLRFRRRRPDGWERSAIEVQPRAAYVLRGEARSEWEHSIPPLDALRYSVTFRTLAVAVISN